jgi:hypothetical protein
MKYRVVLFSLVFTALDLLVMYHTQRVSTHEYD